MPSRDGSEPSLGKKIVRIVRLIKHVVGLDDLSWPHP